MIFRAPRPERNFYILDKSISEDPRLSWAARGLLVFLLGKPDHWRVSRQALINETRHAIRSTGRDGVLTLLAELAMAGYAQRRQLRHSDGTMGEVEYVIHEDPQPPQAQKPDAPPDTEKPDAVSQTAWPDSATRTQVSTEKKASTNNDDDNTRVRNKLSFDKHTGTFSLIPSLVLSQWQACFPLVNVPTEISRAGAWLLANPAQDKKNYQRFLNAWLSRTQDRAAQNAAQNAAHQTSAPRRAGALPTHRPMTRAERGQAAGMAMFGIPAEAYLPGAPLWTGNAEVIDTPASFVADDKLGLAP